MHVTREIAEVAMAKASGGDFERFVHACFATILGQVYVPLGGVHDGGADGIILQHTASIGSEPTHFLQASIQQDTQAKVRHTLKSLGKVGRTVEQLTYVTSQRVKLLDKVESDFTQESGVALRIRDREYLIAHANDSRELQNAFWEHLGHHVAHLQGLGAAPLPTQSRYMADPTVFVFLRQQSDRADDENFANSVTDALALWALQGTDPDKQILMSAQDVHRKVVGVLPSVENVLTVERVENRLQVLSKKNHSSGRQVRWHKKLGQFALPFETREGLTAMNAADEALRLRVEERLASRAVAFTPAGIESERIGSAALVALQSTFESRGLQFADFLERGETSPGMPDLDSPVRLAVEAANPGPAIRDEFSIATLRTVRDCLYRGDDEEREYLRRLAKTYSMLFILRQDPQVVNYLQEMSSHFTLFVGTDLLVLAISERYLERENQSASNLLGMAQAAGATLILTEPVLEEVVTHLQAADREFTNQYAMLEKHLPTDMFGEIPKIMIRAYFYNRSKPGGPKNWRGFLNQFCDYEDLHKSRGESDIRTYLLAKYGMEYESRSELEQITDSEQVSSLTQDLLEDKRNNFELAENDALMVHAVYGRRAKSGEESRASVYGLRTWWLTTETKVLWRTRSVVAAHAGARYMMRPDFLLNFITLAPDVRKVRQTYLGLFPTTLGLELSRRMDPRLVRGILDELRQAEDYDEARRLSVMAKCSDKIKSDFRRRHLESLDPICSSNEDWVDGLQL